MGCLTLSGICLSTYCTLCRLHLTPPARLALHLWLACCSPFPLPRAPLLPAGPRQRAFFEELTREEQQLIVQPPRGKPPGRHRKRQQPSREEMLDSLIFPHGHSEQGQRQGTAQDAPDQNSQNKQQQQAAHQPKGDGAAGDFNSSDVFNIHEIAKVPPLFGGGQQ